MTATNPPQPLAAGWAPPPPPASRRDPALDLVRVAALGRVVAWHTVPVAWLTWLAAMPVMFFVAGALLATSAAQVPYPTLLRRRLARILPALWVYGAFVGVIALAHAIGTGTLTAPDWHTARAVASWVVPVVDPVGPSWQNGWLTTPLWYVRAYLWMVLAAPLLLAAARRPRLGLAGGAGLIVAVEAAAATGLLSGTVRVLVGDFAVYGAFTVAGAAWVTARRAGRRGPQPRRLAGVAVGATVAALGWFVVADDTGGVVSASSPLTVAMGVALLAACGVAERRLRLVAIGPRVSRLVGSVSPRMLTIYLWHPVPVVVAWWATDGLDPPVGTVVRLAVVVVGTAVLVAVIGWVEDLPTGRLARPGPTAAAALVPLAAAVAVPLAAVAGQTTTGADRRVPSFREALGDTAFAAPAPAPRPVLAPPDEPPSAVALELQRALDAWRRPNRGTSG